MTFAPSPLPPVLSPGRPPRTVPAAYGFVLPFLFLYALLMLWPLFDSFRISLSQWNGDRFEWVGPGALLDLLRDGTFLRALLNTALFALGSLLLQLPLALGLALLAHHRQVRARTWLRAIFFLPVLINGITLGFVATAMFDSRHGLLNQLAGLQIPWTTDRNLILPAMVLIGCWKWSGLHMLFFLAGLQSVRREELEAAELDGASAWQRFRHIVLPALRPTIVFVVTMSLIGSFQLFELPFVLTSAGGGVADGARTVVQYLYEQASRGNRAAAAGAGWLLTLTIVAVTTLQWRYWRSRSGTAQDEENSTA